MKKITIAITALALCAAQSAFAKKDPIYTANSTNHWIWVTVYDVTKTIHMDYGWVAPCRVRSWTGDKGAMRGYIRAEVKASTDPTNPPGNTANVFDTTIKYENYVSSSLYPQQDGKSYYWGNSTVYNCRAGAAPNENCCTGQYDRASLATPKKLGK